MKKPRRQKTNDDGGLAGTLTSGGWKNFSRGANAIADAENSFAGRVKGLLGGGRASKKYQEPTPNYASAYANKPDQTPRKKVGVSKKGLGGHRGS